MTNVPSNDGTRDCQMDRVTIPNTHDLNVFAPGRVLAGTISSIDACFDRENESYQRAKRSIADADRRVVRKGTFMSCPPREQRQQIVRAGLHEVVNTHVMLRIQCMQVGAKPRA